ncbi:MAG: RidA family protein [Anaerovibrio sp.]|uniref:RidA family protein n=1 Tax=Anaerovibrio sp. TaxID=1872532 RepID=UPI0025E4BD89|nr:RidA family protein [Anaerovibrio sp.]MCR5176999.1 RidA family protein [Anaerovibrio sp.]
MKTVSIESKLENKGHYVPGMISGGMLYISGQLPVHHETGAPLAEGIYQQTLDALHNVDLVLKAAGCKKENVVLCHVYIPRVEYWDEVNNAYGEFFGAHRPARVVVPSRELHGGALVEIEAVAELQDD